MQTLTLDQLNSYRAKTFRTAPGVKVTTRKEAVEFVKERGFIYFWPIKGVILPSLWVAVAGDRVVADEHDDPGHITWGWKDGLLGQHVWYYARVLRRRNTIISMDAAPFFYALTENYGVPEEDYLLQYEQGRLTQEAKSIFEALLKQGPLDTISLRKAAHMTSDESTTRFNRALDDLMIDFKILPVGVSEAGAWHYAFIYDIVPRHLPDLPDSARFIQENTARAKLTDLYLSSIGAARLSDITRLFGWDANITRQAVQSLVKTGIVLDGVTLEQTSGEWIVKTGLFS
jgi:hypothetical protein